MFSATNFHPETGLEVGAHHLTYCTNIHPGESWVEIRENLGRYLPAVKARLSPDSRFGVGLRLSGRAADELAEPGAMAEFKDFLATNDLYVFTLNGFPYGPFHGEAVKEKVYQPDWRDEERLRYSNLLADHLAELLPADDGLDGSISTVPGAFKPEITTSSDIDRMADNIVRHAAHLARLREQTGRTISLTLEPEPCCFIETIDEAVTFFETHLFSAAASDRLAALTGLNPTDAAVSLRRHLGVCLDLCHAAVEFEDAASCVDKLRRAGISVGKMQVTAGLRLAPVNATTVEALRPYDDEVYLHQVVAAGQTGLARYADLGDAFAALNEAEAPREWRVHFHVPVFVRDLGGAFTTTQDFVSEALALHCDEPISAHLEVETYTWGVLPEEYRNVDVVTSIVRELEWVRQRLAA